MPVDFESLLKVANKLWLKLCQRWVKCSLMRIENGAF